MKHLFNIISLLAIVCMAGSCGDKGYDVSETPTFTIHNADVQYPAAGGSGTIDIELIGRGTPTVTAEKNWCHATISGSTITVSVDGHADSYSRESALTISLGGYTRTIGLYQGGMYFYVSNEGYGELGYNEGDQLRIPLTRDGDMNILVGEVPDWVSASVSGNELIITALEKNGWSKRSGTVSMQVGSQSKTATFVQTEHPLDYDSYLGTWLMTSYDASSKPQENTITFSVDKEGKSYLVEGLRYPFIADYSNGVISFFASQVCGSYTTGGVTYPIIIRMVNNASTSNATSSNGMYSTYDIIDGQLVLTLLSNNASYTGFAFYYSTSASNYYMAKYRTEVKLYKQ